MWMHVVAVENGIVIIDDIGDAKGSQECLSPGWEIGEELRLDPQEIKAATLPQPT
jgi:hypothetical protein